MIEVYIIPQGKVTLRPLQETHMVYEWFYSE